MCSLCNSDFPHHHSCQQMIQHTNIDTSKCWSAALWYFTSTGLLPAECVCVCFGFNNHTRCFCWLCSWMNTVCWHPRLLLLKRVRWADATGHDCFHLVIHPLIITVRCFKNLAHVHNMWLPQKYPKCTAKGVSDNLLPLLVITLITGHQNHKKEADRFESNPGKFNYTNIYRSKKGERSFNTWIYLVFVMPHALYLSN